MPVRLAASLPHTLPNPSETYLRPVHARCPPPRFSNAISPVSCRNSTAVCAGGPDRRPGCAEKAPAWCPATAFGLQVSNVGWSIESRRRFFGVACLVSLWKQTCLYNDRFIFICIPLRSLYFRPLICFNIICAVCRAFG